jgi:hypothetical protein
MMINSNPKDNVVLLCFLINTCELAKGLDKAHVVSIAEFIKTMDSYQTSYFAKKINDAFYSSVPIITSGHIETIWTELLE